MHARFPHVPNALRRARDAAASPQE